MIELHMDVQAPGFLLSGSTAQTDYFCSTLFKLDRCNPEFRINDQILHCNCPQNPLQKGNNAMPISQVFSQP